MSNEKAKGGVIMEDFLMFLASLDAAFEQTEHDLANANIIINGVTERVTEYRELIAAGVSEVDQELRYAELRDALRPRPGLLERLTQLKASLPSGVLAAGAMMGRGPDRDHVDPTAPPIDDTHIALVQGHSRKGCDVSTHSRVIQKKGRKPRQPRTRNAVQPTIAPTATAPGTVDNSKPLAHAPNRWCGKVNNRPMGVKSNGPFRWYYLALVQNGDVLKFIFDEKDPRFGTVETCTVIGNECDVIFRGRRIHIRTATDIVLVEGGWKDTGRLGEPSPRYWWSHNGNRLDEEKLYPIQFDQTQRDALRKNGTVKPVSKPFRVHTIADRDKIGVPSLNQWQLTLPNQVAPPASTTGVTTAATPAPADPEPVTQPDSLTIGRAGLASTVKDKFDVILTADQLALAFGRFKEVSPDLEDVDVVLGKIVEEVTGKTVKPVTPPSEEIVAAYYGDERQRPRFEESPGECKVNLTEHEMTVVGGMLAPEVKPPIEYSAEAQLEMKSSGRNPIMDVPAETAIRAASAVLDKNIDLYRQAELAAAGETF